MPRHGLTKEVEEATDKLAQKAHDELAVIEERQVKFIKGVAEAKGVADIINKAKELAEDL